MGAARLGARTAPCPPTADRVLTRKLEEITDASIWPELATIMSRGGGGFDAELSGVAAADPIPRLGEFVKLHG